MPKTAYVLNSNVIHLVFLIVLAIVPCCSFSTGAANTLSDEPEALEQTHNVRGYQSYASAIKEWESINEVADWMGHNFSYDFNRALDLSETNRGNRPTVAIYSPADLYYIKHGVCIDLARFGVETARGMFPESNPKYVMIEFVPLLINGKTIRRHWIASFQKNGKYFFFADSKRPGYISGPFDSAEDFMKQYEIYRGRKIVSFIELESFKKKKRRFKKREKMN